MIVLDTSDTFALSESPVVSYVLEALEESTDLIYLIDSECILTRSVNALNVSLTISYTDAQSELD